MTPQEFEKRHADLDLAFPLVNAKLVQGDQYLIVGAVSVYQWNTKIGVAAFKKACGPLPKGISPIIPTKLQDIQNSACLAKQCCCFLFFNLPDNHV